MYVTLHTMVIHSRAKHSMTMSKDNVDCVAVARTQSHVINPRFDFEVKGQSHIRIINV